jgi:hypothetical protein
MKIYVPISSLSEDDSSAGLGRAQLYPAAFNIKNDILSHSNIKTHFFMDVSKSRAAQNKIVKLTEVAEESLSTQMARITKSFFNIVITNVQMWQLNHSWKLVLKLSPSYHLWMVIILVRVLAYHRHSRNKILANRANNKLVNRRVNLSLKIILIAKS